MLDRNHSIEKSVCVNVCKWVLRIAKCYIWTSPFTIRREMLGEGVKENWRKEVRGYEWFICQQLLKTVRWYYIYHISLVQFNILKCIYLNLFMLYWTQKPVCSNSILKHHNDTIRCWKHLIGPQRVSSILTRYHDSSCPRNQLRDGFGIQLQLTGYFLFFW